MGKREDNAKQTRAKLLDTADRLIVKDGYERVSVDSIVKASGIAKGTFYNYFKRKEDLIFELSKHRFANLIGSRDTGNQDAVTSISAYLEEFMTVIANSKIELARQWVRYVSASDANKDKWQLDVDSLERFIQQLIREDKLSAKTPHYVLSETLLTQMYGIILSWCIDPKAIDPIQRTQQFCTQQLELLVNPYQ